MQLKWMEDFVALAEVRSYSRAAELRHVTHPAFGRRIRALEAWAGTALVERDGAPVTLTAAGASLLENARQILANVDHAHSELLHAAGRNDKRVTVATGRTLARTLTADLLLRLQPVLGDGEIQILTRSLTETSQLLERGEADFMLIYHHPLLAVRLSGRQYSHVTVAKDRLVLVSRADAQGKAQHALQQKAPLAYLAYAGALALGRLVEDHLANNPHAPNLQRTIECDSADAVCEYALKGLGVAWLPWSMVSQACKAGQLVVLGDEHLEIGFEVRAYRAKRRLSDLAERVWQQFAVV